MKHAGALCLASLLITACAHTSARPDEDQRPMTRDDPELVAARERLDRSEGELGGLMAEARPVDCKRAAALGETICALAERICVLVARTPADPSGPAQCTDARTRCKTARDRVQAACPGK